jgi:hypothetical protein
VSRHSLPVLAFNSVTAVHVTPLTEELENEQPDTRSVDHSTATAGASDHGSGGDHVIME